MQDAFYVKHNEIQAYCHPAIDIKYFNEHQKEALAIKVLSLNEWMEVFEAIDSGSIPDWLSVGDKDISALIIDDQTEPTTNLAFKPLGILSPTKGDATMFDFQPTLSFDSTDSSVIGRLAESEDNWRSLVSPTQLLQYIDTINKRVKQIKMAWSKPFRDIESSYKLLVADLQVLNDNITILHTQVGNPIQVKGADPASLWSALDILSKAQSDLEASSEGLEDNLISKFVEHLEHHPSFQQTLEGIERLDHLTAMVDARMTALENSLRIHGERFKHVKQVLQHIPQLMQSDQNPRLDALEARLDAYERNIPIRSQTHFTDPPTQNSSTLEETIASMQEEIRLLKQRVVGSGITIGNQVFQSYEDFAIWVKTGIPSGRFGLFVDGHSLLDFFSFVGFLDAESVANSFHSSNKSGFKSMLETRVAASMQNFFPAPFGKVTGEKIEDSESLPGIPDPDKFDNGSTGVRYKILRGMKDVSSQLESNIDKVLRDYPDAKQMARDLLLNSKRFVIDLLNFMSQDYNSWKLRGYTKKEAWKMTCRSVHRILDDLQGARMTGRDAGDGYELDRMTATYIWATAKAHEIMDDYLKYQFFEHPAIAAVLARHLAASAVLPDDSLPTKLSALETKLNKLSSKVDGIESKVNIRARFVDTTSASSPTQSILKSAKNGGRGGTN